jgi:hypothetical protein
MLLWASTVDMLFKVLLYSEARLSSALSLAAAAFFLMVHLRRLISQARAYCRCPKAQHAPDQPASAPFASGRYASAKRRCAIVGQR